MTKTEIPRSKIISEKYKKENCNHWYVRCECLCGKILEQRVKRAGGLCPKCKSIFIKPPVKKHANLTGKRFGTRLVKNQYYNKDDQQVYVDVICDCGNEYSTRKYVFLNSKFCRSCKDNYIYDGFRKKYLAKNNKKTCQKCNIKQDVSCYHKDTSRRDGLFRFCKNCTSLYTKSKKYSISEKKVLELMNRNCQICGEEKNLNIDHCHKTGNVRGVLCNSCNVGIGLFKDNIELLKNSIKYLEG